MPYFDYKCECGNEANDKLVRNSEVKVECPKCGAQMQKQISATNYRLLMGEGFHNQHDAPNPNW